MREMTQFPFHYGARMTDEAESVLGIIASSTRLPDNATSETLRNEDAGEEGMNDEGRWLMRCADSSCPMWVG